MNKKNLQLFFGFLIIAAFLVWMGVFGRFQADPVDKNLKIYFLNVGQGDSEYIKFPNGQDVLIDGGPDNSVLTELGKVMSLGDRKIDLVVLTHPHADHLAGLNLVLNRFEIGEVWQTGVEYPSAGYDQFNKLIKEKNINEVLVDAKTNKFFGPIKFSTLTPLSNLKNSKIDNINNASIINLLEYNNFSALFLGDVEISAQIQIYKNLKKVTVLKVAHHGSTNGTNKDLLDIIRPAVAVIEVGAKNNYGHPAPSIINLLKSYATQIYRTDQNGTVEIDSDGINWWVK